jgi:hypothetical protein
MLAHVWTEPWYEGRSAVTSRVPGEAPVALNGRPFLIEPRECRRTFIPTQRPGQDDSDEPGEQSLTNEGLWRRSQSDWGLGAGQTWLDEGDAEIGRRRFRASRGIDVFGAEREISLLPDTEEKLSTGQSDLQMLSVGDYVYVRDGTTVRFTNAAEATPTWTTTSATNHGGGALDIATSGSHVYILGIDNTVYRATPGTTSFGGGAGYINPAATITRIWVALGRLFAAATNVLYEITATPSETAIITHPDASFRWSAVIGTPYGLFLGGSSGSDGEVRQTVLEEDGSAWVAPVVVASLRNEEVNALAAASTALVIATSLGFRLAEISGQGVQYGAVVTTPGEVNCLDVEVADAETFFLFGWSNIETGVSGLGRIRPSRLTEPLVPAYASDVATADGGTVMAALAHQGRRFFATSGGGFYGSTDDLVESGTLSTGRVRFGLTDTKVFSDVTWRTAPLAGEISATATFDDDTESTPGLQTVQGSVRSGRFTLGPRTAEWGEITFTLTRDDSDAEAGPQMRWWVMRAIPSPSQTQRILLAIRNAVTAHGGLTPARLTGPASDRSFIADLVRSHEVVRYQEGETSELVWVQNMEERPDQWNDTVHAFEGLLMVEMLTTEG